MRKSYRVKKESEFQRVFETHNSVANHKFIIYQMAKPDVDFLVIARPAADGLEMAETKKNLVHALKRANLFKEKSEEE